MGMVDVVGRICFVSGSVDGVADTVRLLSLVGEGDCPESRFFTCSTDKRGDRNYILMSLRLWMVTPPSCSWKVLMHPASEKGLMPTRDRPNAGTVSASCKLGVIEYWLVMKNKSSK